MRVRIIDNDDHNIEWRDIVLVDQEQITTISLRGGSQLIFDFKSGVCTRWPEKRLHPYDHAEILRTWIETMFNPEAGDSIEPGATP